MQRLNLTSIAYKILYEAALTAHYIKRKSERGDIDSLYVDKEAYKGYDRNKVLELLTVEIKKELNNRIQKLEEIDYESSYKFSLGVRFFKPVLISDRKYDIEIKASGDIGTSYLGVIKDNKIITLILSNKAIESEIEKQLKTHVNRIYPETDIPIKVLTLSNFEYEIKLDKLLGIEKQQEKSKKLSIQDLDYKVRTDYRTGASFIHNKYGSGVIEKTSSGVKGTGDSRGVVDWIDVKYNKPFVAGGKLQSVRRFNNILTTVYFS